MLLAPNTLLQNRYLIMRLIGQGGMGAVYEAKDQRLGHPVALKQTIVSEQQLRQAFEREARILARLRHSALPVVSDYFIEGNSQFLVMQYIPGDDLETLLQRRGHPFGVLEVLEWADQLLDGLIYLHGHQSPIIHRDIKPSNIKLSPEGRVILLDFGISKGGTMSAPSTPAFTLNYAPPEQIEGKGTNERSDLYSLGVTLHHLLTDTVPPTAVSRADPLKPANQLNPQVPAAVANVLTQATALSPTKRPNSAKEMRAMLKAAAPKKQPVKQTTKTTQIPVRWPKWLAPVVGVLLLLVVVVWIGVFRRTDCVELDIETFTLNNKVEINAGETYTVTLIGDAKEELLIKVNVVPQPCDCQPDLDLTWKARDETLEQFQDFEQISRRLPPVGESERIQVYVKDMRTGLEVNTLFILKSVSEEEPKGES